MSFTFVVAIWAVLGAATLAVAIYRIVLATHNEEDVVRLAPGQEGSIRDQASLARKLSGIDRWGQTMTVVTAVIGLGLAATYLYTAFESPNPGPNNFFRMNSPSK